MLAHIELGADEAEGPNLAAQPQQIPVRDCVSLVRTQALIDQVKVGLQRLRRPVSFGFALQGGPEPPPDEGKLPPVGLLPGSRSQRFRVIGESGLVGADRLHQAFAHRGQPHRLTHVPGQRPDAFPVERQQRAPLELEGLAQHSRVGMRVAILVAAHPGAQPQRRLGR